MRNKYAGICGKEVKPGEGHFQRVPGYKWIVKHSKCVIEERGK